MKIYPWYLYGVPYYFNPKRRQKIPEKNNPDRIKVKPISSFEKTRNDLHNRQTPSRLKGFFNDSN